MGSEFQTLLARVRQLFELSQPAGYGQPEPSNLPELTSLLSRIKTVIPKSESRLIPTENALNSWQLLTAIDFQKQRDSFLRMLEQLEKTVESAHLTAPVDELLSDLRLAQVRENFLLAQKGLYRGDFKTAVVMAGAALEALLHARIAREPDKFTQAFVQLNPSRKIPAEAHEYRPADAIAVIVEAGCLPSALAKYAKGLQQCRNIVHPGVEAREKLKPKEIDAEVAVKVCQLLIEKLWM
ncbi:MAG: hypothetical protein L3J82_01120 [Planctomycetes bacterium]|nr:hypothetical protein [Planctomycetota bacterium]